MASSPPQWIHRHNKQTIPSYNLDYTNKIFKKNVNVRKKFKCQIGVEVPAYVCTARYAPAEYNISPYKFAELKQEEGIRGRLYIPSSQLTYGERLTRMKMVMARPCTRNKT